MGKQECPNAGAFREFSDEDWRPFRALHERLRRHRRAGRQRVLPGNSATSILPDRASLSVSPGAKRDSSSEVALQSWLSSAIDRCNPKVPAAARGDALQKGLRIEASTVIQANRLFRHMLVSGVDVERPRWDGDHRGRSQRAGRSSGLTPAGSASPGAGRRGSFRWR